MTREEAVEVILKGHPWCACWLCLGSGRGTDGKIHTCTLCKGEKSIVRAPYAKACELLGRPLPKLPPKTIGFEVSEELVISIFHPRAIPKL
jgi:hypothetical protein